MSQVRVLWISCLPTPHPEPELSQAMGPVSIEVVRTTSEALAWAGRERFDAAVLCLPFPETSASAMVAALRSHDPDLPVFVRQPEALPGEVLSEGQAGGFQLLGDGGQARRQFLAAADVRRSAELTHLATATGRAATPYPLVGDSPDMRQISRIISLVGPRRATVLITGETGTGKELAARALHLAGPRSRGPFVAVNCNSLPENLLEAELFGHVKGAFTGAVQARTGRFEQAHGGTLFLDEIGDLSVEMQAKLLRVLQEREFQRLGSSETVKVDVRVVAATNCSLPRRIEQGRFREDLYYRLNVVPLEMPPLRQRPGDIPDLAAHFLTKVCAAENLPLKSLSADAVDRLCRFSWPGNVRQLENSIEMAVALSGERRLLEAHDFPLPEVLARSAPNLPAVPLVAVPDTGLDMEGTLTEIERSILEQALQKTGGNKKAAAQMLRLKRTTLSAKVRSMAASAN